ncbi:MAG: ATP synthase subunit I [Erysipelotrichaceae bacterium]|nr:ATP synthase subunit I [Erysipelotrichaceae bacterium]
MNTELILKPTAAALIAGLLTGMAFSLVHRWMVEESMRKAIKRHNKAKGSLLAGAVLRITVLALPLLTAMVIPRYLSVFTVALGLMSVKLYLFFKEILFLKRR